MTLRVSSAGPDISMTAGFLALAFLLLAAAAWSFEAASPAAAKAAAATQKRDITRCNAYADVSACYDAIRRTPGDPALLIALGDALVRAKRPADAIRNYSRAAELAPNTPGLAAKINAAQAKLPSAGAPSHTGDQKRFSNAASETQSH
jgi:cytochrome c-type biogenesis protein CcmH/NrfG